MARFQDMLREWFKEVREPIDLLPIPDGDLTLPEKYTILAAIHDKGWKGEKINPWSDPIPEEIRAEAARLLNDGKEEEAVRLLEDALTEEGIGALKDQIPYAVLLGKVQAVPESDVPFIEHILTDVEQDLEQLVAQIADGTASDFPDGWDPDWGDAPQNPDEAARLLYEALDDWGQVSWSDRDFDDPLELGNDVYGCVCALERLITSEGKTPRLPHPAGTWWPEMVRLSRKRDRSEADSIKLVKLRGKMLDWLRETFPNAFAEKTEAVESNDAGDPVHNSRQNFPYPPDQLVSLLSHLLKWSDLSLRYGNRLLKIAELHPEREVIPIDDWVQFTTPLGWVGPCLAPKSDTEDPYGGKVPIQRRNEFSDWFRSHGELSAALSSMWELRTVLGDTANDLTKDTSPANQGRFATAIGDFETALTTVRKHYETFSPIAVHFFGEQPAVPNSQELRQGAGDTKAKPDGPVPPINPGDQQTAKTLDQIAGYAEEHFGHKPSTRAIQNWRDDRSLRMYKRGKLWVFSKSDLETLVCKQ